MGERVRTALSGVRQRTALQQPVWYDMAQAGRATEVLEGRSPLVRWAEVGVLRTLLALVASGEALVVQAGDCAEDPEESTVEHVRSKTGVIDMLAGALKMVAGKPVLRVGRIAGQFAKPRSASSERVGEVELPVYRGHLVNGAAPTPESRRADPLRLLTGYMAASEIMDHLGWGRRSSSMDVEPPVWTSHEALVLDYELPQLRRDGEGRPLLTSTHWPWVGERTRQLDGAHVALLAEVINPVACKLGPQVTVADVLGLCERLDPDRRPGRLTFIVRMGAEVVAERLPFLVQAVRESGRSVAWLSDPMHANTTTAADGRKTRYLEAVKEEVRSFRRAMRSAGGVAGGLHLETTPDDVAECVANAADVTASRRYTSLCDPRLTPAQALEVVGAWAD